MMRDTDIPRTQRASRGDDRSILVAILCAAAVLGAASSVDASEPYTHDGLHFRFGVGVVAGWSTLDDQDNKLSFSGPGILDGVQLGAHPLENLTLFVEADALTLFAVDKNHQENDSKVDNGEDAYYTFLTGAGIGHHIMPVNLYISGAAGVSFNNMTIGDEGAELDSRDIGLGLSVMVAKEWWVSESWSAGIAGQFLFTASRGQGSGFDSYTVASGLLMTASFN